MKKVTGLRCREQFLREKGGIERGRFAKDRLQGHYERSHNERSLPEGLLSSAERRSSRALHHHRTITLKKGRVEELRERQEEGIPSLKGASRDNLFLVLGGGMAS